MRSWELKGKKKGENLQIVKFIDLLRDPPEIALDPLIPRSD